MVFLSDVASCNLPGRYGDIFPNWGGGCPGWDEMPASSACEVETKHSRVLGASDQQASRLGEVQESVPNSAGG